MLIIKNTHVIQMDVIISKRLKIRMVGKSQSSKEVTFLTINYN